MKNVNESIQKDTNIDVMVTSIAVEDEKATRYPHVKRILATLDKFLNKKIAAIALFYFFAVVGCGIGLIVSGEVANAASGGTSTGAKTSNTWLWSLLAVLTFLFMLASTRAATLRLSKKNRK
ncbi:MAG: hypothetical protein LBG88_04680 [Christensenellaceae bacterium]|jgi:hypothetical protein|nr:hypothetical protein [Christensenellaceae bacterium]